MAEGPTCDSLSLESCPHAKTPLPGIAELRSEIEQVLTLARKTSENCQRRTRKAIQAERAEKELLREALARNEALRDAERASFLRKLQTLAKSHSDEVEELQAEHAKNLVDWFEQLAELRNRMELPRAVAPSPPSSDLTEYEAELVRYHRELDSERDRLDHDRVRMQMRLAELEQSVRHAEQELARKRCSNGSPDRRLLIDQAFARQVEKPSGPIHPRLEFETPEASAVSAEAQA